MRLILGEEDIVLGVGDAVEFDTTQRRWFGSTSEGPAEVLSLFGRPWWTHPREHKPPPGVATTRDTRPYVAVL